MTKDGVLRESCLYRGKRHDEEVWSVLAPEWTGRQAGVLSSSRKGDAGDAGS